MIAVMTNVSINRDVYLNNDYDLFYEKYRGEVIFAGNLDDKFCGLVRVDKRHSIIRQDLFALWSINTDSYFIDNRGVEREVLIDTMKKRYPDHYEWLLWNPDVLNWSHDD